MDKDEIALNQPRRAAVYAAMSINLLLTGMGVWGATAGWDIDFGGLLFLILCVALFEKVFVIEYIYYEGEKVLNGGDE